MSKRHPTAAVEPDPAIRRRVGLAVAAKLSGLPYATLHRAAQARAFPTVRLTPKGAYRVCLDDLEAWLQQQTVPAVEAEGAQVRDRKPPTTRGRRGPSVTRIEDLLPPLDQYSRQLQ